MGYRYYGALAGLIMMVAGSGAADALPGAHPRELRKEITLYGSLADVWKLWTTTEGLTSFLSAKVRFELRPGGPFEILFDATQPPGLQGSEGCVVIGFKREKLLSFTWIAPPRFPNVRKLRTRVDIHFERVDEYQTNVTLVQTGWGKGKEWDDAYAFFDNAWGNVMTGLNLQSIPSAVPVTETEPLEISTMSTTPKPSIETIAPFDIAGISARTINSDEGNPATSKLGGLWGRFYSDGIMNRIPGRDADSPVFGVYADYESDVNGHYTTTVGARVVGAMPEGTEFTRVHIEGGDYLVFVKEGKLPAIVVEAWRDVWNYFADSHEYSRLYTTDFEKYAAPNQVKIYIAVRKNE